jgi:hypothetical protein
MPLFLLKSSIIARLLYNSPQHFFFGSGQNNSQSQNVMDEFKAEEYRDNLAN